MRRPGPGECDGRGSGLCRVRTKEGHRDGRRRAAYRLLCSLLGAQVRQVLVCSVSCDPSYHQHPPTPMLGIGNQDYTFDSGGSHIILFIYITQDCHWHKAQTQLKQGKSFCGIN